MTFTPDNFVVWAEIPVTDLPRATAFYSAVFETDLKLDESGPDPMAIFSTSTQKGVAGHLYPGKPAPEGTGSTIHMACPDKLEDALERVKQAGGQVVSEIFTFPPGRFAYCLDTDGNSLGIFTP